jgi:hypothetical protein
MEPTLKRRKTVNLGEVVIEGTLKPDGTLQLDQKPSLAPGRVKVILQPAPAGTLPQRGLADVIDEIRQSQQARGFPGRSAEEIEAALKGYTLVTDVVAGPPTAALGAYNKVTAKFRK